MENKSSSVRYVWIDILRAIGMFLILWGHFFPHQNEFIYSCTVPLFFIISGYLHRNNSNWHTYFSKIIKSLLIPYLVICFSYFVLNYDMIFTKDNIISSLLHSIYAIALGLPFVNGGIGVSGMWFVYVLMILKVLFNIVESPYKRVIVVIVLMGAILPTIKMQLFGMGGGNKHVRSFLLYRQSCCPI